MILGGSPIASAAIADDSSVRRVLVTGVAATGQVGSVTTVNDQTVSVTGLAATGQVGSVTAPPVLRVLVTGVAATGSVGAVTGITNVVISVTGLAATGAVSAVTQETSQEIGVANPALLVTSVGEPTITGGSTLTLTGVEASASVGSVLVWGKIIPGATTVWTEIAA